jgi:type I restriction enzyme R subunit
MIYDFFTMSSGRVWSLANYPFNFWTKLLTKAIISYQEPDLEALCANLRHLLPRLPKRGPDAAYAFNEDVRLPYFRLQKIGEGAISLSSQQATSLPFALATGAAAAAEEPLPLSRLIDVVNERFDTVFNEGNQLFFDQITAVALRSDVLAQAAAANSAEKLALVFGSLLETLFIERMDQNVGVFSRYMSGSHFQDMVRRVLAVDGYKQFQKRLLADSE